MSENDFIAEYIKEKYPQLLGVDFAFWKFARQMGKVAQDISDAFKKVDWSKIDLSEISKK